MTVTIRDVARRLNLSITTVSRALDGYTDVAEETRQLVIQTAHQMGYVPNQAARQLRRQRLETIGYILPTETPRFGNPFFAEFIAGLGDEASSHNFDLLVTTTPPTTPAEQESYERWVSGHKVDGMILNRIRLRDWRIQYLGRLNFPFVTLHRSLDLVDYPSIEVNDRVWFCQLINHLIALGHQRIAYVGASTDLKIQDERYSGYLDGLQVAGIPFNPLLVCSGDLTAEGGYRAASLLLEMNDPPTSITCVDDMTAFGVLHAAREHGFIVGKNLAVAGYDGIAGFEHTQPPLTTVNLPIYQIARQMVQMLLNRIAGVPLEKEQVFVEPVLEIRESTTGQKRPE